MIKINWVYKMQSKEYKWFEIIATVEKSDQFSQLCILGLLSALSIRIMQQLLETPSPALSITPTKAPSLLGKAEQ